MMPRYEVRFYDALDHVKVSVELTAADALAAEQAAKLYLALDVDARVHDQLLLLGVVKELS